MEEQIINSKQSGAKWIFLILIIVCLILQIVLVFDFIETLGYFLNLNDPIGKYYNDNEIRPGGILWVINIILIPCFIFAFVGRNKSNITVTKQEIKGKTSNGRSINVPIKSINSVSNSGKLLRIETAGKTYKFLVISNAEKINKIISDLIRK